MEKCEPEKAGNYLKIEKLEEFKEMLIRYYESGEDETILAFMKEHGIRRVR